MSVYLHILLAADFSDQDEYVAHKAVRLAAHTGAQLSLIHVLDDIPMPDTPYGTLIPLDIDTSYSMLENEKQRLNELGDAFDIDPDHRWLVWGEPKQEITRIAEQERVDLIVVGSHGRHGLALLLGSTANSVLHHAKCDVLAVRLQPD
ncbi:universal stress protein [Nitrosomonas sp. ANs5]|uniref:universal stress protein n=1 Tax=Nitrosomonas sp. ANs5 TaxID=3423941 RepID=UPI003D3484E9